MFKSFWFYSMNIGCIQLQLLKSQLAIDTKQLDWTYNLNRDLYNCYTKAKENLAIGYMKHIKQNWDIIHPEFSHLSGKNLRDQASRIYIKNKIVMETVFSTDSHTN